MHHTLLRGIIRDCRIRHIFHATATILLACCALALFSIPPLAAAKDAPAVAPTPSAGKAMVCIYRVYRFTGSAAHDNLYVNGVFLAKLLNSEYACMEVSPGTVVVSGLPDMYYGGIVQSAGAALNEARKKENERLRIEAEAGKTYYMKWTSEAMATGIKVTLEDPATGAKEMSKLHPSKPPEDKEKVN
ncbi:MAG TPA: DUF2846 domain-containing protein [Terracidiphilus sp.]|nr:DUF2846 domain-containing protein [Terracidiphilus sp.]